MMIEINHEKKTTEFLLLVRAGLFEDVKVIDLPKSINFSEVLRLAEEQSVVGLIADGLKKGACYNIPLDEKLKLIGKCQLIEQRNSAMNRFIAELIAQLNKNGICALLVKGQGMAQCYERPLWRSAGDIDLLLDEENYNKAKVFLAPLSEEAVLEDVAKRHLSIQLRGFTIELHGRMPFVLSHRADKVIDEVIADSLLMIGGERPLVRVWKNENTDIYLPKADNDVILVFSHYLHHFFVEGVGLKQICDWCRLLWTYREEIDRRLLGKRLQEAGLMSEWKAFASLAVKTLGMPVDAMPFYDESFKRKGEMVLRHILKAGNFGQNKDLSYRVKYKGCAYKMVSFWRRLVDSVNFVPIFPLDTPKFFVTYVFSKVK